MKYPLYRVATANEAPAITELVQSTIKAVYPLYYPQAVVDFFLSLHSLENITEDIDSGKVRVFYTDGKLMGTASRCGNHITRLYIENSAKGKGGGSFLLRMLEQEIAAEKYIEAVLDSSLPAVCFYENRNYRTVRHQTYNLKDNCALVYEVMKKML